jgi:hypothetical protein
MSGPNHSVLALITGLAEQSIWGALTLKFRRGQIVHITKEESTQPVPNNRRNHSDITHS